MKRTILFLIAVATTLSCLFAQTTKNPFSKLGYKKQVMYTSSKGEFEEFHDNADIVEIGSVYFNTKINKVVGYISEGKEVAEVASATSAMSVDPLCEKYYWISPYAYCLNNPIKFIDPNGMEVDLSKMSEEDRKRYESQVKEQRSNSKLFDTMYSFLESSKNVFVVQFGQTTSNDGKNPVEGQFVANKDGGGTVTFLEGQEQIKSGALTEEFFHAYQDENKSGYAKGEFNVEFEAKVATTAIGAESGGGYGNFAGMSDFQSKIGFGDYGKGSMQITPNNVTSKGFLSDYNSAANKYATYNKNNNIGNSHYKKSTTVAPYSLQQLIKTTYGK